MFIRLFLEEQNMYYLKMLKQTHKYLPNNSMTAIVSLGEATIGNSDFSRS